MLWASQLCHPISRDPTPAGAKAPASAPRTFSPPPCPRSTACTAQPPPGSWSPAMALCPSASVTPGSGSLCPRKAAPSCLHITGFTEATAGSCGARAGRVRQCLLATRRLLSRTSSGLSSSPVSLSPCCPCLAAPGVGEQQGGARPGPLTLIPASGRLASTLGGRPWGACAPPALSVHKTCPLVLHAPQCDFTAGTDLPVSHWGGTLREAKGPA